MIHKPNGIVLVTGPTGSRQDHHALLGAQRAERDRRQADHHRGPGRVRHRRHHPDADRRRDRHHLRRSACGRSCGRIPTRSWSARSATWKRPKSPSRPRSPGTWCSARCTPTTPRARSPGCATWACRPFLITATVEGDPGPAAGPQDLHATAARKPCPAARLLVELDLTPDDVRGQEVLPRHAAATVCNNTGYKGRVGLFELMIMNDELRDMIIRNASTDELRDVALQHRHDPAARRRPGKGLRRHHHHRRSRPRNGCGSVSRVSGLCRCSETGEHSSSTEHRLSTTDH